MADKPIVHLIAAARPNFMKIAPLYHAFARQGWAKPVLVHTGQHYDANMSGDFLRDLGLPDPDISLGVGSGSHAQQTAGVMLAYEEVCRESPPDFVVVVGDVNSTLAVTITAKKLLLPVGHMEAGLRSRDRTMPEEINRIVTDALCDLLWTPSPDADENLRAEGVPEEKIVRVGNVMLDAYEMMRGKITADPVVTSLGLTPGEYGVVTLHRPFNVDEEPSLSQLVEAIRTVSEKLPLVFPVHPRTRSRLEAFDLWDTLDRASGVCLLEPLSYIPFMSLVQNARIVITDSGGIQEETTYLGIPCLTLRPNTERPITITHGTNQLVTSGTLVETASRQLSLGKQKVQPIEFWDGHTADRVVENLRTWMQA